MHRVVQRYPGVRVFDSLEAAQEAFPCTDPLAAQRRR